MSIKLEQHCIEISYTQCCPNTSETTLHKKITCAIIALSKQTKFSKKKKFFLQENNIRSVVLVCLGQHCTKQLSARCRQCWPTVHSLVNVFANTAETTLYKKITCAMLTHSPQTTLHRKII